MADEGHSLIPLPAWARVVRSAAPVVAREAYEGDRPAGAAADAERRMGPDELRRQLARIEARLREMGDLEQEVEDLLVSIRTELARQPAATRASTRP